MTALSSSFQDRRIRRILKSPAANVLSPRVRFLAQAAWGVSTPRSAHLNCLTDLPAYVSAEMEGRLSGFRNSTVQEHLEVCRRRAAIYADLLEIAMLDAEGRLPAPPSSSSDLSFLESSNE